MEGEDWTNQGIDHDHRWLGTKCKFCLDTWHYHQRHGIRGHCYELSRLWVGAPRPYDVHSANETAAQDLDIQRRLHNLSPIVWKQVRCLKYLGAHESCYHAHPAPRSASLLYSHLSQRYLSSDGRVNLASKEVWTCTSVCLLRLHQNQSSNPRMIVLPMSDPSRRGRLMSAISVSKNRPDTPLSLI